MTSLASYLLADLRSTRQTAQSGQTDKKLLARLPKRSGGQGKSLYSLLNNYFSRLNRLTALNFQKINTFTQIMQINLFNIIFS